MEEQNREAQPQNEQTGDTEETLEAPALKEKLKESEDQRRQLFERAKKAENELKELRAKAQDTKPEASPMQEGLDFSQKAYLLANGIKEDDFDFVEKQLKDSRMPLDELIANEYFQSKLKGKRNLEEIQEATPDGTKRSTSGSRSQAEYWIKKSEMPPDTPENRELRREIVNKRMAVEKSRSKFSDVSVIS